jgi:L-threonylcarbamoyladenylate synthase
MSIGIVIDARAAPAADVAEEVAHAVFAGGTVIFPNDTSYGIGCDPYSSEAIDRIYAAKGRPDNRPLTLHVATPQEFLEYAGDNPLAVLAAKRLLPGPVILLIAKPAFVSDELAAGLQTLAFRVPDDPLARALLDRCGPLAGTTVNRSGAPRYRGDGDHSMLPPADLLVEHGPTRYDRESSIVDLTGAHARLLREGAISATRLAELLGPVERPTIKVRTQPS